MACITGVPESENHLFLQCEIAQNIWHWLIDVLQTNLTRFIEVADLIRWPAKQNTNSVTCQLKLACVYHVIWEIRWWRNGLIFENKIISKQQSISRLIQAISTTGFHTGIINNDMREVLSMSK